MADNKEDNTGSSPAENPASFTVGFHRRSDGYWYCDDVKVSDIHRSLKTSRELKPLMTTTAFVYSRRQLQQNVTLFYEAIKALPLPAVLNFSVKANFNPHILKLLGSLGCGVTLVSGMEMVVALKSGFKPQNMLLNGSGKTRWEVSMAVDKGVLLNVDSDFDLRQIIDVCQHGGTGVTARVLLRLNLDIDPNVHEYMCTGSGRSKFGLDLAALSSVTRMLTSDDCPVRVEGLHCHLGSTITDVSVFRKSVERMLTIRQNLVAEGLPHVHTINVGGGLAIDYTRFRKETLPFRKEEDAVQRQLLALIEDLQKRITSLDHNHQYLAGDFGRIVSTVKDYIDEKIPRSTLDYIVKNLLERLGIAGEVFKDFPDIWRKEERVPTPADLINSIADVFVMPRDRDVTVMFEPGRSIVGNAGIFLTSALGCKTVGTSEFLVVDGAMNDVLRPSLYGAYHHIHPASPTPDRAAIDATTTTTMPVLGSSADSELHVMDVVGPVCESGDFLGKDRLLPRPEADACVVVHDTGAYCSSMASNYNLRMRPAEVMIEGSKCFLIRRPDDIEDFMTMTYMADNTTYVAL